MIEGGAVPELRPPRVGAPTRPPSPGAGWLAAIEELEADGLEDTPGPKNFPQSLELQKVSYQFWNCSEGEESREGRWAAGPTPDGKGEFEYLAKPTPLGEVVDELNAVDPRIHGTPKSPAPPVAD